MAVGAPLKDLELPKAPILTAEPNLDEDPLEADRRAGEALEQQGEQEEDFLHAEEVPSTSVAAATAVPVIQKDADLRAVEDIMEKDLEKFFKELPPAAQVKFKKKGEDVAKQLTTMVKKLVVDLKLALKLLRDWLLVIPGVNKFYLEQEAKIKVDQLKKLVAEKKQPT